MCPELTVCKGWLGSRGKLASLDPPLRPSVSLPLEVRRLGAAATSSAALLSPHGTDSRQKSCNEWPFRMKQDARGTEPFQIPCSPRGAPEGPLEGAGHGIARDVARAWPLKAWISTRGPAICWQTASGGMAEILWRTRAVVQGNPRPRDGADTCARAPCLGTQPLTAGRLTLRIGGNRLD